MKSIFKLPGRFILLTIISIITFSCVPTRKLSYFNDISELGDPIVNPKTQKLIMPFDKLYIRVLSIDPQTSQIFNFSEDTRYDLAGSIIGYVVNELGNINFPFIGDINVSNLTTSEAAEKIQKALNEYVPNTTVLVKYIDNKVSILGEVIQQGMYSFSQDKLSIYEALALGGGLTRYGNRKNILVIRHEGDKVVNYKLNLSDSKIMNKDQYYILPNDVIVVEPLKSISTSYQNITYQTILSSITTLIAVLLFTGVSF